MKNFFIPHFLLIVFLLSTLSCDKESEHEQEKLTEIELKTLNLQFSKHLDAMNLKNDGTKPIFNVILSNEKYIKHKSGVQFEFEFVNLKRMLGSKNQQGGKTFIYFENYLDPSVFELVTIIPKANESNFDYDINNLRAQKFNGHLMKSDIYFDKIKVEEYNNGEFIRTQTPVKPENIQVDQSRTELRTCYEIVLYSYIYENGFWIPTGEQVIGYSGDCANNEDQENNSGGGGDFSGCDCSNNGFTHYVAETSLWTGGRLVHNLVVSVQDCHSGQYNAICRTDTESYGYTVTYNNNYIETGKTQRFNGANGVPCGWRIKYSVIGSYSVDVIILGNIHQNTWQVHNRYFNIL